MKKMVLLIGLLVLSVLMVSCTQGTLAGEAIKIQAAQCPNGCDIVKKLNSAIVVDYSSETPATCNEICTRSGRICVDAELSSGPHTIPLRDGRNDEVIEWSMTSCTGGPYNTLRCRCY